MKIFSGLLLLLILFSPDYPYTDSRIKWRIGGEAGIYRYRISGLNYQNHLLSRGNGLIQIEGVSGRNSWHISLQLKPERYSNSQNYSALKTFSKGYYQKKGDNFNWGLGYDARQYEYFVSPQHLSLANFKLNGHLAWIIGPEWILTLYPAYYYRDISSQVIQNLDALSMEINLNKSFSYFFKVSSGWYFENFYLENNFNFVAPSTDRKNQGLRSGPVLSADYKKRYLLSAKYLLLLHHSRISRFPSFEHYIRFIAGSVFAENWTVFLYADYYWNKIKLNTDNSAVLLTLPPDSENRIELKVEKMLRNKLILFTRFGYFRDILFWENFSTRGLQLTFGLEYNH